ncbi:MAG TPA: hypothetical protein VGV92_02935 [Gammaproteobacteria bacterium]|nr:hypothetical protein [Gammaproteobacteria bacterium]
MEDIKPKKNSSDAKLKLCEDLYRTKKIERDGSVSTQPFESICRFITEGVDPTQLSFFHLLDTFVEEYFDQPDPDKALYLFAKLLLERGAPATKETCQRILARAFDRSEEEVLVCLRIIAKKQPATFLLRFEGERTALHCAVERAYTEAALFLINDCKIDLTAVDSIGYSAVEWAELYSNTVVLDALSAVNTRALGPILGDSPILSSMGSPRCKPTVNYPEELLPLTPRK